MRVVPARDGGADRAGRRVGVPFRRWPPARWIEAIRRERSTACGPATVAHLPRGERDARAATFQELRMDDQSTYDGRCFCGSVRFSVTGAPAGMGYCHCSSCRSWSAGPVNAFSLWKPESMKITDGEALIGRYNKTPRSERCWCTRCGGHVFTRHPAWNLIDVYAASIPAFPFKAGVHVHYQESVLPMRDGLPKMKDLPKEMGGSGEVMAE
jgi:hypothetical protein